MRLRGTVMAAVIGVVVGLSACGNGAPASSSGGGSVGKAAASGLGTPAAKSDATADLKFSPSSQSVKVGQVVQWTNSGSVPHNVTFDKYADLTSQTLQQNDTWQVEFTTPGTYAYHCTFHPGMDGTITVSG